MATASLSLDLDNEWSYLKTHGDPSWESWPTYLDVVVPRFLEMLGELDLRITVFVVGRDAADPRNRDPIAAIAAAGHEIGNHSFRHEPWFHRYSESEIEDELARTEEHLEAVTGQRPVGFRGPGYSLSTPTLEILQRRGYRFDASTLPTFLGPLARLYYLRTARLSEQEREERAILFGGLADGLRPLRPYRWRLSGGSLLEIPVTTLPLLRVPFHLSYVLYASTFSPALAAAYFRAAIAACRLFRLQPSLLLHPLDFLGAEDAPSLGFFPAMQMPAAVKLERTRSYLQVLKRSFEVIPMGEHAERLAGGKLRNLDPPA